MYDKIVRQANVLGMHSLAIHIQTSYAEYAFYSKQFALC